MSRLRNIHAKDATMALGTRTRVNFEPMDILYDLYHFFMNLSDSSFNRTWIEPTNHPHSSHK